MNSSPEKTYPHHPAKRFTVRGKQEHTEDRTQGIDQRVFKAAWRCFAFLAFLVVVLGLFQQVCGAQDYPDKPERVVEKYCELDAQGAQISGKQWSIISEYTTWDFAPGWDGCSVISRYTVKKISENQNTAKVKVTYYIIGQYSGGYPRWKNIHKARSYIYTLIKQKGFFKIQEPQLEPHICLKTAIKMVKSSLPPFPDKEEKRILRILETEQKKSKK